MELKAISKLTNGNYIAITGSEASGPGKFARWNYLRLVEFDGSCTLKNSRSPCVVETHDWEMVDARYKGGRSNYAAVLIRMWDDMWKLPIDTNSVAILVKDASLIPSDRLVPLRFPKGSHGVMFDTLDALENYKREGLGDELAAKIGKGALYFGNTYRCTEINW